MDQAIRGRIWHALQADPPDARPSSWAAITIKDLGSVCRPRCPPPSRPHRSRPLPPARSADPGPAAPLLAGTCAATSRRSCSCPAPAPAATPGHWLRSSGSTNHIARNQSAAACACPGRSCPQSPTSGDHNAGHCSSTDRTGHASAARTPKALRPSQLEQVIPARLFGIKPSPRTRPNSAGTPPRRHTTYWGYLSQVNTQICEYVGDLLGFIQQFFGLALGFIHMQSDPKKTQPLLARSMLESASGTDQFARIMSRCRKPTKCICSLHVCGDRSCHWSRTIPGEAFRACSDDLHFAARSCLLSQPCTVWYLGARENLACRDLAPTPTLT